MTVKGCGLFVKIHAFYGIFDAMCCQLIRDARQQYRHWSRLNVHRLASSLQWVKKIPIKYLSKEKKQIDVLFLNKLFYNIFTDIDTDFLEIVKKLVPYIISGNKLTPKRMNGKDIKGQEIFAYIKVRIKLCHVKILVMHFSSARKYRFLCESIFLKNFFKFIFHSFSMLKYVKHCM